MGEIKLLDCTLRDGGYLNDWNFGRDNITTIFERLVSAKIDIIELGFIDDRRKYDQNRSIFPDTSSLNLTYKDLNHGTSMLVGMIDYGTCRIDNVDIAENNCLDGIRVIFKKEKMYDAISFCGEIKKKGYKVFAQAVSITSYSDKEFIELLSLVNELQPYAFSLVDTYGLLHKQQLEHYFEMADTKLDPGIGLGYHAHNNFQLAYANCIEVMEKKKDRMLIVDGTLYGMGKSAGNAPMELLAMYMNEYNNKDYYIHQLLEAIDVTLLDIYRTIRWGYNFKFFLSALSDCHPNYVSYLQDKGKLSVKSIYDILTSIEPQKKLLYDEDYIEKQYILYQTKECNDFACATELKKIFENADILLLASGNNLNLQKERVESYIHHKKPIIISVNFVPQNYHIDYLFLSNAKRYVQMAEVLSRGDYRIKIIAMSNITSASGKFDFVLNYGKYLDDEAVIRDNPLFMILRLLQFCEVSSIALAGFDGYDMFKTSNYVNANMEYSFTKERAEQINQDVRNGLKRLKMQNELIFVTDSYYTN